MNNLPISNSAFSSPRRVLPLWPTLLLTLVLPLTGCAAGGSGSAGSTGYVLLPADQRLIGALPPPQLSSVDLSGSCRNTDLAFESQRAQARWPAPGYIMPLQHWAMYHAGSRVAVSSPRCADNELAVRLWQSAIGSPVTGQMSERDATEFVRIIDAHDSRYAHVARQRTMTKEETAVDVYRSLAEQGDPKAQYRLGAVYEQQGNWPEAERWYRKAAAQGLRIAQDKLHQSTVQNAETGIEANNDHKNIKDLCIIHCDNV
ncbi:MAG: tetratricopeptide repeat protein, partial [Candidatus Competibacter denitrificans]